MIFSKRRKMKDKNKSIYCYITRSASGYNPVFLQSRVIYRLSALMIYKPPPFRPFSFVTVQASSNNHQTVIVDTLLLRALVTDPLLTKS